jgi:hypothetical protein
VTSTLGIELVSTQSPHAGRNMSRTLRPLAALAMVAMLAVISAGCSSAPAGTESLEGLEEAVDLLGRDHRPGVRDGDVGVFV